MELRSQNILFLLRSTSHGGTENVVVQLCEILKPEVNRIIVCSAGGFRREILDDMGIPFYEIPDLEHKSPRTVLSVLKILNHIMKAEKVTVVHTHHRMAAFYAAMLSCRYSFIFMNTSHNTFTDKRRLTRFAYKKAHLIACGEMVKKNLVNVYGFPDDRVTAIHNAVKPFDGEVAPDPLLEQLHADKYFIIGNVGRLSEQKGMEYFIRAIHFILEKHPRARFVIVGDGEYEQRLKSLSDKLQLDSYLYFLGYRSDIQNLMAQLDLVVLSSLWEGLPLTPIEAFSVGRTIVATAVDGSVEIVRDGVDGLLIKPGDSKEIAQKVSWMIEHPKDRMKMEEMAYERFTEEFSFHKFGEKYMTFYRKLVSIEQQDSAVNETRRQE